MYIISPESMLMPMSQFAAQGQADVYGLHCHLRYGDIWVSACQQGSYLGPWSYVIRVYVDVCRLCYHQSSCGLLWSVLRPDAMLM